MCSHLNGFESVVVTLRSKHTKMAGRYVLGITDVLWILDLVICNFQAIFNAKVYTFFMSRGLKKKKSIVLPKLDAQSTSNIYHTYICLNIWTEHTYTRFSNAPNVARPLWRLDARVQQQQQQHVNGVTKPGVTQQTCTRSVHTTMQMEV